MDMAKKNLGNCQAFLMCKNKATSMQKHPILGEYPICKRCKDKFAKLEKEKA